MLLSSSDAQDYRKLADGLVIAHARPEFAVQLEQLQRTCFPTLAEEERFKSYHYLKHMSFSTTASSWPWMKIA